MEKAQFEYKNRLRNLMTVGYWIVMFFGSLFIMINLDFIRNFLTLLIWSIISMTLVWPIKRFKTFIYVDAIVFKEKGFHPLIKNDFGVAFENINEYRINNLGFGLFWIVLKRRNGKTIRKLFSFSGNEISEFIEVLSNKVDS